MIIFHLKSSKKHESSKDDFQMLNSNGGPHLVINSSSSKHRSGSNVEEGSSRRSHDKT